MTYSQHAALPAALRALPAPAKLPTSPGIPHLQPPDHCCLLPAINHACNQLVFVSIYIYILFFVYRVSTHLTCACSLVARSSPSPTVLPRFACSRVHPPTPLPLPHKHARAARARHHHHIKTLGKNSQPWAPCLTRINRLNSTAPSPGDSR